MLDTPYSKSHFRFSPDGQFVVYASREASRTGDIYVASFPSFGVKRKVSNGGGDNPAWTKGGREIVYVDPTGAYFAAEVRSGASLEVGTPKKLFQVETNSFGRGFEVTPDGQRFLIAEAVPGAEPVRQTPGFDVVLNWAAGLK